MSLNTTSQCLRVLLIAAFMVASLIQSGDCALAQQGVWTRGYNNRADHCVVFNSQQAEHGPFVYPTDKENSGTEICSIGRYYKVATVHDFVTFNFNTSGFIQLAQDALSVIIEPGQYDLSNYVGSAETLYPFYRDFAGQQNSPPITLTGSLPQTDFTILLYYETFPNYPNFTVSDVLLVDIPNQCYTTPNGGCNPDQNCTANENDGSATCVGGATSASPTSPLPSTAAPTTASPLTALPTLASPAAAHNCKRGANNPSHQSNPNHQNNPSNPHGLSCASGSSNPNGPNNFNGPSNENGPNNKNGPDNKNGPNNKNGPDNHH